MANLSETWLTEGLIDVEYKKYLLLSFLQNTEAKFKSRKLYPSLSNLVFHYNNLLKLRQNKELIRDHFPKEINQADFENLKLYYKTLVEDDELMKVLEEIIEFSIPKLKQGVEQGATIYEEIASQMRIEPIGITPINTEEGYLLINQQNKPEINIFLYRISVFEHSTERYRSLRTDFLGVVHKSITNTFEQIKSDLIKQYKNLPNPATFLAYFEVGVQPIPVNETMLPVTKRQLMQHLSAT